MLAHPHLPLRLANHLASLPLTSLRLIAVQPGYYDLSFQARLALLGGTEVAQLCKAVILENTAYRQDFAGPQYPRLVCVVTQYIQKFSTSKLQKIVKARQNELGAKKVARKYVHFRLAKEEAVKELTGYEKNEVCPLFLGAPFKIPVMLSEPITKLASGGFFLGAGHVDLKVWIRAEQFMRACDNEVLVANLGQQKGDDTE